MTNRIIICVTILIIFTEYFYFKYKVKQTEKIIDKEIEEIKLKHYEKIIEKNNTILDKKN